MKWKINQCLQSIEGPVVSAVVDLMASELKVVELSRLKEILLQTAKFIFVAHFKIWRNVLVITMPFFEKPNYNFFSVKNIFIVFFFVSEECFLQYPQTS